MLELINLTKKYGNSTAVDNVSLTINKGEFFCLLGSSGCGKSTILRMIAGFESITSGRILLDGKDLKDLPPYKRNVNTVFQNYALFPNMTIFENIAYGLKIKKIPDKDIIEQVNAEISRVGLQGFEKRMPSQLSGGQQQRVALARALINKPQVLLLDEPLSALDKKIAEQTRFELAELQRKVGITFIYVTHNQTEALTMADRIAVMHKGIIEACGAADEIYEKPKTYFVADFIGSINFFQCKYIGDTQTGYEINILDEYKILTNKKYELDKMRDSLFCIRPEQLKLSLLEPKDFENGIPGVLRHKIYMGENTMYLVEVKGGAMIKVSINNYLSKMSNEFFELNEQYYINWSKASGEVINA
jgi:spermidine/putrescine ABC transporter ATP-binding subunit